MSTLHGHEAEAKQKRHDTGSCIRTGERCERKPETFLIAGQGKEDRDKGENTMGEKKVIKAALLGAGTVGSGRYALSGDVKG